MKPQPANNNRVIYKSDPAVHALLRVLKAYFQDSGLEACIISELEAQLARWEKEVWLAFKPMVETP